MSNISSSSNKKRSKLNLSSSTKLTADMGILYPVLAQDVYPGDTFSIGTDVMVRHAPMLAPILHKVDVYLHSYFVPWRLLEDEYEEFVTGGEKGDNVTIPAYINSGTGWVKGTIPDILGLPLGVPNLEVDAKFFRAYAFIYNEFYRQQDLQDPIVYSTASGLDTTVPLKLLRRNWNKDYFTSGLPFQQKGPAVALPFSGNAPVVSVDGTDAPVKGRAPIKGLGLDPTSTRVASQKTVFETSKTIGTDGDTVIYPTNRSVQAGTTTKNNLYINITHPDMTNPTVPEILADTSNLSASLANFYADLSDVGSATVNDLRMAFALQRVLERNMRCGARYTEFIQSTWGVHNRDYRLQRPEFLGGGKSHTVFTEILQTSSTDETSPLGTMAGHGFSALRGKRRITKSFTEYGVVMQLLSVMPKSSYNSQGIEKKFSIKTRFDLPIPDMAHTGEDAILNKEIYATGFDVDNDVWGYTPKYEYMRHNFDKVVGDFRDHLDFWTLVRQFDEIPLLNDSFLECVPDKRIYAETSSDNKLRIQVYHNMKAIRPIPRYGIPGFIDH